MSKKALPVVVATIIALAMVATATAVTFDWWNTIADVSDSEPAPPTIINAYVEPVKVRPGDLMSVVALVQDDYGIDEVTAKMPFEGGHDLINLELAEGTALNGEWRGTWTVHDTIYKEYVTTITAFSKSGLSSSVDITWTDPPSDPWWNSFWNFRKNITIHASQVTGTQTNFPVLINITGDTDLATDAQNNGDDIVFTNVSGNEKLDHEIEYFNGTTGDLIAWVRIPTLSGSTDTVIYV